MRTDRFENSAFSKKRVSFSNPRRFKKIILSRITMVSNIVSLSFFFLIQLRFCERDRWRRKIFRCYPRNASIGSVLERGVYSIYSHDYSRALYFADRATLSIDFFRYGNWDSGVDLTVLGYPLSFFSRPGCPWTWKITVKIINQGRMTVDRSPLLSFRSFHETRRYRETLHNISSRVVFLFSFFFFSPFFSFFRK